MSKRIISRITNFGLGLIGALLVVVYTTYACTCETPEVCQAYAEAEKVFVGELLELRTKTIDNYEIIVAKFKVEKNFKGRSNSIEEVEFGGGGCEPPLTVGKRYFVYDEPVIHAPIVCNRTRDLAYAKNDLAYARNISAKNPIFTISGVVKGLTDTELDKVRIVITSGNGKKLYAKLNKTGKFAISTRWKGDFDIELVLPSESNILLRELGGFKEVQGKKVKYSSRFLPNACDFKTIQII